MLFTAHSLAMSFFTDAPLELKTEQDVVAIIKTAIEKMILFIIRE
jgi:hypothetical protein